MARARRARLRAFAKPLGPGSRTLVALIGHPVHAMLVTFPIAFLIGLLGSDLAYLYLRDPFWARTSLWLAGGGAVMAIVAGVTGTIELLFVRRIRMRIAGWEHFVAAVMLISVAVANWGFRLDDAEAAIWPWGLYLSAFGFVVLSAAGWLGGALVFEHKVGTEG